MNKKIAILLFSGALGLSSGIYAQQTTSSFTIPVKNGSVFMSLQDKKVDKQFIEQQLVQLLNLSGKNSFTKLKENTDNIGMTHISYQQLYNGLPVDNAIVLVHFKNGIANSINGRIAALHTISTIPTITKDIAVANAEKALDIVKIIKHYPSVLMIASTGTSGLPEYKLVYKTRIDGKTSKGKVVMMNVLVDAQTGKVLKKVSLIAYADVNGSAHTLYRGIQTIVTDDSIPGQYRLKDNARKIITLDATGMEPDMFGTGDIFFPGAKDITHNSTTWDEQPALMKQTLNACSPALMSTVDPMNGEMLSSIVVKDTGNNQINMQYKAWLDYRWDVMSAADLPVTTGNMYLFPKNDLSLIGSYGTWTLSMTSMNMYNSCYYPVNNLAAGIHPWSDGAGNSGTYEITKAKNPALDAHWGMERTHDFYQQTFSRNSYDGNGGKLINYINGVFPVAGTQNNAAAMPFPYFSMVYGLGDGQEMDAFVALDVMGHEFTHMVTEMNGNGGLEYENESGALNESFSDIMGTCIEFFTNPATANWTIGEDCSLVGTSGMMRSMSSPKSVSMPQPDTYDGQYWDVSDPHINSGVQNKWFYLLSVGGSGTNDKSDNYSVTGITIQKAQQIAYRNLINYLTPTATFQEAYYGSIQAATDLYGTEPNVIKSVKDAWFAVGIGDTVQVVELNDVALNHQSLHLFPNPASGTVTISSDVAATLNAQIVNVTGAIIKNIIIKKGNNEVDIHPLAKGLYFVKYNLDGNSYVQKLSVL